MTPRDGESGFLLTLTHDAQRIEAIGANAIVVGSDGTRLSMSAIRGRKTGRRRPPHTRPVFVDDRIFALLGYEIVEGRLAGGRVEEIRRVDFTPR